MNNRKKPALWAAAILMATSAVGPGFLTQTTVFTSSLLSAFGFVILVAVVLDIIVQLNIWQLVIGTKKTAQELADALLPGLGVLLTVLIVTGGLAFNIGNIAGAGLGLQTLIGISPTTGAVVSTLLIAVLLINKEKSLAILDKSVSVMGILMILLTAYVAFVSEPPVYDALAATIWPSKFDARALLTIVGGTVGGYICFAGAHRLLEDARQQPISMKQVQQSAITGIAAASLMRYLLFLAALGVFTTGLKLQSGNPAADVFEQAAGKTGVRLFGIVMWCAAITSVLGSAYTSISFARTYIPALNKRPEAGLIVFISFSTLVFVLWGRPVQLLLIAGLVNGFILPVSMAILLFSAAKNSNGYKHPMLLKLLGWLITVVLLYLAQGSF